MMSEAVSNSIDDVDVEAVGEKQPRQDVEIVNPREGLPTWKWILTLLGLYLGAMLYGLDTTIAADVQASVYESLGHIEDLPWVGLGFPMASVATILLIGRLYVLFDVKPLILTSIFIFEAGSALCGGAPNANALIVGRVIAGIGGAGMYLGALTYISSFTTNTEAALYNALTGLTWGIGAILGPVIGGAFSVSGATWRWAFYINLPLAGLFSPIYLFVFPSRNPLPGLTVSQKLAEIDWAGAVLNGAIFVLFMIAVSFGGSTFAWKSGASIALWVVFGLCLVGFIIQQWKFVAPSKRIFPVAFLRSRTMLLLYVATASAASSMAVTLYYIPLFFQFTRGDSAFQAAVRLLPFIVVLIFFIMFAGGLLPIVGRYQIFYVVGGVLTTIGGALLFTIDLETSVARIYGCEIIVAAGTGLAFQNAYAIGAAKMSNEKAHVIGFINVAQIGSIALSLSIAGCLFQNLGNSALKDAFVGFGYPDAYVQSALAGRISPVFKSANKEVINVAVRAIAQTIQRVFGAVLAAGAALLASSLFMRFEKLDLEFTAGG